MSRNVIAFLIVLIVLVAGGLLWWQSQPGRGGIGVPPVETQPTGDPLERAAMARQLLDQGVARFEIAKTPEDWAQATSSFLALRELAPSEPAAHLGLAAVAFKTSKLPAAREHLEAVRGHEDAEVAALAEYGLGRLAYEENRPDEVAAAYQRAAGLRPTPWYHYAAAEALRAKGADEEARAALLAAWRTGSGAEPNVMVAVELALEGARSEDAEVRRESFAAMEQAAAACLAPPRYRAPGDESAADREVREKIESNLAEARGEVLAAGGSPPRQLRIAGNLLKGTSRFQADSKGLRLRLEVQPLGRLVLPELRSPPPPSSPELRLVGGEGEPGLPTLPGPLVALAVVDDAVEGGAAVEGAAAREAGLLAIVGATLQWLPADGSAWQPVAAGLPREARQIETGDLDGDGLMEAVILGASGLAVLSRNDEGAWTASEQPGDLANAGLFSDALIVDHNHDGFLDLLALEATGDGDHNLVLFRNQEAAGLGSAQPFPIKGSATWQRLVAADLDLDGDQDLLLAGTGGLWQVINQRQELFEASDLAEAPLDTQALAAADLDGDGYPEGVVVGDGSLQVFGGSPAGLTATPMAGSASASAALNDRLRPQSLAVADLDLDGRLDLVVGGETTGNGGSVQLLSAAGRELQLDAEILEVGTHVIAAGVLPFDSDGDRAPDLISWNPGGEVLTHRSTGLADQGWLGLRLRAPKVIVSGHKVPMDARGVRIESFSATGRQVLQPLRPNVTLGFGQHPPHLVRMIWPNGMSEYLFDPATRTDHEIMLVIRLEGSCPYLYAWDGQGYRFVTDVLGISPLGMQVAPHVHNAMHPEEYLRMPDWLRERDGRIELSFTEELREVTFLDQLELVAVDHPAQVHAYNGERFVMPPVEGLDLRLLGELAPPAAVTSHRGEDASTILRHEDHRYLTNHEGRTRYQGLVNEHTLTLDLGDTARDAGGRVALLLVGWLQWGNTSTNVAIGHDPGTDFMWPRLEVPDGQGGWRVSEVRIGLPAGKPKAVALDLTGTVDPADPRVRIVTNLEVYWDRIAVAPLADPAASEHDIHRLAPATADYRYGGYSRWYRPAPNGPDLFDYADRRPYPWREAADGTELRVAFDELEGFYVAYGDVTDLITDKDDLSVTVGAGDEILVSFETSKLPPLQSGWQRTYFLHSEGWDKDGDFNTAHGQTLEPLPFHARQAYPSLEPFPDTPAHRHYQQKILTRWVSSDRLIKLAATAPPRAELPAQPGR